MWANIGAFRLKSYFYANHYALISLQLLLDENNVIAICVGVCFCADPPLLTGRGQMLVDYGSQGQRGRLRWSVMRERPYGSRGNEELWSFTYNCHRDDECHTPHRLQCGDDPSLRPGLRQVCDLLGQALNSLFNVCNRIDVILKHHSARNNRSSRDEATDAEAIAEVVRRLTTDLFF